MIITIIIFNIYCARELSKRFICIMEYNLHNNCKYLVLLLSPSLRTRKLREITQVGRSRGEVPILCGYACGLRVWLVKSTAKA